MGVEFKFEQDNRNENVSWPKSRQGNGIIPSSLHDPLVLKRTHYTKFYLFPTNHETNTHCKHSSPSLCLDLELTHTEIYDVNPRIPDMAFVYSEMLSSHFHRTGCMVVRSTKVTLSTLYRINQSVKSINKKAINEMKSNEISGIKSMNTIKSVESNQINQIHQR